MKKIISLFIVLMFAGSVSAFEPRIRTVYFSNSSKDYKTVSIMGCDSGAYSIKGKNGKMMFDFLQPCISVGLKTNATDQVSGGIGLGLVEVMDVFSLNVGMLPDGNMMFGTGISMKFDDSMSLFE